MREAAKPVKEIDNVSFEKGIIVKGSETRALFDNKEALISNNALRNFCSFKKSIS